MDRLANTVRPYAWGSVTTIPALLASRRPANRRPNSGWAPTRAPRPGSTGVAVRVP